MNQTQVSNDEIEINEQEVEDICDVLIPLFDGEDASKWKIGDELVARIHPDGLQKPSGHTNNGANGWYTTIARRLSERGREVSESTLRNRYRTSLLLPPEARYQGTSWYTHFIIATQTPAKGPVWTAPERMRRYIEAMKKTGRITSKRSAQEWLGVHVAPNEGTPSVTKFVEEHPEIVVSVIANNPEVAKAVATSPAASLAVSREQRREEDARGVRSPADLDKERARKRLENGPTLVEILELGEQADKLAVLARKFQTPESGHGDYRDTARIQIEAAIARIRASVQHIEDVMNGNVDTRIPDDISTLVSE